MRRSREPVAVPTGEHAVPDLQGPPHTPTHESTMHSGAATVPVLSQKKPRSRPEREILGSCTAEAAFEPRCLIWSPGSALTNAVPPAEVTQ